MFGKRSSGHSPKRPLPLPRAGPCALTLQGRSAWTGVKAGSMLTNRGAESRNATWTANGLTEHRIAANEHR